MEPCSSRPPHYLLSSPTDAHREASDIHRDIPPPSGDFEPQHATADPAYIARDGGFFVSQYTPFHSHAIHDSTRDSSSEGRTAFRSALSSDDASNPSNTMHRTIARRIINIGQLVPQVLDALSCNDPRDLIPALLDELHRLLEAELSQVLPRPRICYGSACARSSTTTPHQFQEIFR